ncbi:conjugal transfer protein TraG N-terminal domain-containing protein [Legionella bozemanae]|uniref:Protein TraG n=1 Tax=Legionella bozemanae TaxID=447 RepID=A0A0W0RQ31_LEGBO|nr:conjugal transfer protein TraG N-terminal domain-containing protein [Legionella bozemanae]KTC73153.1 protein TraG [Legionella bozemanae]STP14096.1 conjugal transfer mating pair stabilization protein TraG [Legionella bozemanae]
MAVTMQIYTITGGELIKAFYNATAALFHYDGVLGVFRTALIIGGVWTVGQFIVTRDIRHMFFYIFKYAFVISFILTPTCNLQIHDRTDPLRPDLTVDNVPLVLGVAGGLSSLLSDKITRLFEFFFHSPNDMDYSQTGMIMGAKLFLSAANIKITDPMFNANMQKFMQQCVFYDVMYDRYSLKDINQARDIWELVKSNASVARGFIYDRRFRSCVEAATLLDGAWNSVIEDAKAKYAGFVFGNHTEAKANFEKYLPQAYNHLTAMSGDAAALIRQNMMANAIRDGVFSMGARVNSKAAIDSFSASRTQDKIPAALSNIGLMSAYWLPMLQSLLFCIVIGCFIFVLFFFPFPCGITFFQFYITLYVWLALWAPMFTVINYIMTTLTQFSLSFVSTGVTTLAYQTGINQAYENMAALGGYLVLATTTLSYMLISRQVGSFMAIAQQPAGIVQNAASSAAEEAQMGNYSYGNTSFANHNGFNSSSFHNDRNARVSLGGIETSLDSGSIARISRDGSETLTMATATSHTPLNIQLGESTRSAFSELSDNAKSAGFNKSIASSQQYAASLRSLAELGETQSHNEQSGLGHQISTSAGFNQAASKISNLIDTFAHDHNISRDEATKVLGAASINFGASGGFGTGSAVPGLKGNIELGGNLRREWDKSNSHQDARLMNEARRFSDEHHFTAVVNEARQATKDEHFRASDEFSGRLANNFSAGFDKSMHYRDEAMASLSESESYHRQATLSNEQTASINLDAQTGFIDWLSHHRAPNSQGTIGLQQAEWLIRHDPELAQSYARQFVAEKTEQTIKQFQKNHPINEHLVQQKNNVFKNHITGTEGVDHVLNDYSNTLNEKTKNINVGNVSKESVTAVNKDFVRSNKELSKNLGGIVQDGSQLMQDVIVAQSNKDVK